MPERNCVRLDLRCLLIFILTQFYRSHKTCIVKHNYLKLKCSCKSGIQFYETAFIWINLNKFQFVENFIPVTPMTS